MKSLKELYKVGFGPSSSHTMGPCMAANEFSEKNNEAEKFVVTLYGSLAATGKGHFTDIGVSNILGKEKTEIIWCPDKNLPFHPNGMNFKAFDKDSKLLDDWTVYSIGGGEICEENGDTTTEEVYPFKNLNEIIKYCTKNDKALWQIPEIYEGEEIWDYLSEIYKQMEACIERGLEKDQTLPGGLKVHRKARTVYQKANLLKKEKQRTGLVSAYAYASAEENASLGQVVTAPTCGSCGVLPAVLKYAKEDINFSDTEILHALAIAGIIGLVVKQNGSISGAEVGCQGEIGVASAMASAAACYLYGGTLPQIEYAAEIGLEHFLGLTCDPVKGLVQIPCIERNALAANRAFVASELSLLTDGNHIVPFDSVVKAMLQTGHDLPQLYRETSTGGLSKIIKK